MFMLQHGPCCPNQPRQYGNACILINEMTKVSRWKSLWFWFEISPYQLKLESDSADRKIVWRYAIKSLNIYQLRMDCSVSYQGVSQKMIIVTVFRQFGICDWYSNCSVAKVATKGTGGGGGGVGGGGGRRGGGGGGGGAFGRLFLEDSQWGLGSFYF